MFEWRLVDRGTTFTDFRLSDQIWTRARQRSVPELLASPSGHLFAGTSGKFNLVGRFVNNQFVSGLVPNIEWKIVSGKPPILIADGVLQFTPKVVLKLLYVLLMFHD